MAITCSHNVIQNDNDNHFDNEKDNYSDNDNDNDNHLLPKTPLESPTFATHSWPSSRIAKISVVPV